MKKITFLFILLTSFTYGQVLSEDFESGLTIPAGWTNNDIAGNGEVWTVETGGEAALLAAGNTNIYTGGECVGNYATFDSDGYGDNGNAEEAALESPVFSCASLTQVTLSFNHYFAGDYGGFGYVEVFNGTSWTLVETYSGNGYQGGAISLDVSTELAGVANAQVRFRWVGNWSVAWYLDNVSVFECTVSAPDIATVTSPANGATNVPIAYGSTNSVGPFEWVDAVTGDPADSYNFNLGETPAGNDVGTISGFDGGNILYSFQPNTTYYWSVDAVNCGGTTPGTIWSFTTAACTEISAPPAVTNPTPSNLAPGVPIGGPDGSLNFSWTGTGNPDDTYVLYLGTSNPPTQDFTNFESGDPLTGLAENTTYFWYVDSYNCFGSTSSPIWTFTTGTLSNGTFEVDSFKVYPNPTSDILNINSSEEIESVVVYNLLGQSVKTFNGNEIVNNSISISELTNGIYVVKISSENSEKTIRILKE